MKINRFPLILLVLACAIPIFSQNVVIKPKKIVYRRPKPEADFKKTFIVRRAVATAATAALSQKITSVISPESVLGLNIKEELGEYQWLEEADYEVVYNRDAILTMRLWMNGTAAYPDDVTKYVVVDLRSGAKVKPKDAFTNITGLAAAVKTIQKREIAASIAKIKKDPEAKDADPSQLFAEANFRPADLKEFSVNSKGVTFYYDYGFPHVLSALQPEGAYFLSWDKLRPFVRRDGLLGRFVS